MIEYPFENFFLSMPVRLTLVCLLLMATKPAFLQTFADDANRESTILLPNGRIGYLTKDSTIICVGNKGDTIRIEFGWYAANRALAEEAGSLKKQLALQLVQARVAFINLKDELKTVKEKQYYYGGNAVAEKQIQLEHYTVLIDSLSVAYQAVSDRANRLDELLLNPVDKEKSPGKETQPLADESLHVKFSNSKTKEIINSPAGFIDLNGTLLLPPCRLAFHGKDSATGENRKDVEPIVLFTFTSKDLEVSFPLMDMFYCIANLTSISGGLRFLNLEVIVASVQAPELLGVFELGSLLELSMLDGQIIKLLNNRADKGTWNSSTGTYSYKCQFPIGAREERLLRNGELDSLTLRWSKVIEIFPIHEMDFFKNQFDCLDNPVINH